MDGFGNCTWNLTSRRRTLAAGYPHGAFAGGAMATLVLTLGWRSVLETELNDGRGRLFVGTCKDGLELDEQGW